MTVMLYKSPGKHNLHGVMVDYVVVDEADVESRLEEGWSRTPLAAHQAVSKPKRRGRPPKAEVEAQGDSE